MKVIRNTNKKNALPTKNPKMKWVPTKNPKTKSVAHEKSQNEMGAPRKTPK